MQNQYFMEFLPFPEKPGGMAREKNCGLDCNEWVYQQFHCKLAPICSSGNDHLDESGLSKAVPSPTVSIGKMILESKVCFVGSQTVVQAFPVCPHQVWVKSSCPLCFSCSACQAWGQERQRKRWERDQWKVHGTTTLSKFKIVATFPG